VTGVASDSDSDPSVQRGNVRRSFGRVVEGVEVVLKGVVVSGWVIYMWIEAATMWIADAAGKLWRSCKGIPAAVERDIGWRMEQRFRIM